MLLRGRHRGDLVRLLALLAELDLQIALAQLIREGMVVPEVDSDVDFLVDIADAWHPLLETPVEELAPAHRRGWGPADHRPEHGREDHLPPGRGNLYPTWPTAAFPVPAASMRFPAPGRLLRQRESPGRPWTRG